MKHLFAMVFFAFFVAGCISSQDRAMMTMIYNQQLEGQWRLTEVRGMPDDEDGKTEDDGLTIGFRNNRITELSIDDEEMITDEDIRFRVVSGFNGPKLVLSSIIKGKEKDMFQMSIEFLTQKTIVISKFDTAGNVGQYVNLNAFPFIKKIVVVLEKTS